MQCRNGETAGRTLQYPQLKMPPKGKKVKKGNSFLQMLDYLFPMSMAKTRHCPLCSVRVLRYHHHHPPDHPVSWVYNSQSCKFLHVELSLYSALFAQSAVPCKRMVLHLHWYLINGSNKSKKW